jgi:SAM-dependent methyltransferase
MTQGENMGKNMGENMDSADIRDLVRNRYGSIASAGPSCCGAEQAKSSRMGYTDDELQAVPEGANLGLGCGNPQAIAALRPGEVLIDLGSGAGFDCLLAARQVGPEGRVIGVDMTHEMLGKARDNAARVGVDNVEFRLGELEHLPIADAIADVIISNCVINLVPDKAQVFREAFRVLRPGGRLAISDVVNINPLPPELASDKALLCGCVAGAASAGAIEDWLTSAGFVDIAIAVKPESRDYVATWAEGRGVEKYVAAATIEAHRPAGQ